MIQFHLLPGFRRAVAAQLPGNGFAAVINEARPLHKPVPVALVVGGDGGRRVALFTAEGQARLHDHLVQAIEDRRHEAERLNCAPFPSEWVLGDLGRHLSAPFHVGPPESVILRDVVGTGWMLLSQRGVRGRASLHVSEVRNQLSISV